MEMFSDVESSAPNHQRVADYMRRIGQANNTPEVLATTSLNSSDVASEITTSLSTEPQSKLFVPFLGQSNAEFMSTVFSPYQPGSTSNDTSGAIVLDRDLSELTGSNVVTSDSTETNFAVGGSKVNGNGYYQDDNYVWWYPDQNQPGGALRQAEQGLKQWLANNGAQPNDEIAIVWSQGESDVGDISYYDPNSREQFKKSTIAVFDYLKNNLGYTNITFYIVPTGRIQTDATDNISSLSSEAVEFMQEGVSIIRDVQAEIALEKDDVHLAPDYADLNMVYEEGQIYGESYDQDYSRWSTDFWHLGHDGLKVNGSRLAQYIALERGQNNVISFTDSFGDPAESVSIFRAGILDLNISQGFDGKVILGTNNPDLIVGTLAADNITGGNGNDVIVASQGNDILTGGAGRDVFFYTDAYSNGGGNDRITDFELGRDRIDLSEPLARSGYSGSDPVADGYVTVNSTGNNTVQLTFDSDGYGSQAGTTIVTLENVDTNEFSNNADSQFIFTPTEF